jgi:hypothetical protein
MKSPFLPSFVPALVAAAAAVVACTTTTVTAPPAGPPPCDPTQCAAKNECIPDAQGVSACRIPCAAHTDCPFNTQCLTSTPQSYCVRQTTPIEQKPQGQWGYPCLPSGGLEANPACSVDTGFGCYGAGTTDALAYCTQYDCTADLDCAGGFYCATINNAPNVKTDKRSFGKTRTVCLKRTYCSPCASDFDCAPVDGKPGRCATDDTGAGYCTVACDTTANCRLDAACNGVANDGTTRVCRPRAGVCKGDGSLCSPCLADTDCPNGFCIKGGYSPETFCSVKAAAACPAAPSGGGTIVKGDCPAFTGNAGAQVGCQSAKDDESIPVNQCVGLTEFDDNFDIGCYTKH